jgi:hypothetical protein
MPMKRRNPATQLVNETDRPLPSAVYLRLAKWWVFR